jgi:hypothetical protein
MDKQDNKLPFKTYDDLLRAVLAILPDAQIEEDNYGQLIVYTNKKLGDSDPMNRAKSSNDDHQTLVDMTDADFEITD